MEQRKRHLKYLRRVNFPQYITVLDNLGLPYLPEEGVKDLPAKPQNKKLTKWQKV